MRLHRSRICMLCVSIVRVVCRVMFQSVRNYVGTLKFQIDTCILHTCGLMTFFMLMAINLCFIIGYFTLLSFPGHLDCIKNNNFSLKVLVGRIIVISKS